MAKHQDNSWNLRAIQWFPVVFIPVCFLTSRIVLTIIGVVSHGLLQGYSGRDFPWQYSKHVWLSIWAIWDSGWYLDIAKNGYALSVLSDLPKALDPHQINFGFFPLYPLLIGGMGKLIGGHVLVCGIVVSNICVLLAAWFLYKLVLLDRDSATARRAVFFLFAFPTSFVLSGVFAESLFLLLSILVFYGIKKEKFVFAFVSGIFLGLSRPTAVFALPAVCLAYAACKHYDIKKMSISFLCCAGIPIGYGLFAFFAYSVTGDWSFYTHVKQAGWGSVWSNPLLLLAHCVLSKNTGTLINGIGVALGCLLLMAVWKRIGTVHLILGLSLLVLPLTAGAMVIPGMLRYMAAIFPLFIAYAAIKPGAFAGKAIIIASCILQGILMVIWTNGFSIII